MQVVWPKWVAHDVADWNDLLVDAGDGRLDLSAATAALLNYMPEIGITSLTQDNAADAWCRIAIHQALLGSFVEDPNTGRPLFLTRSDVFRHIGVQTEGADRSFADFCTSLQWRAQQHGENGLPSFVANGGRSLLELCGIRRNEDPPG